MCIIHEARWTDGEYDQLLDPISTRMREIEARDGLASDEFWAPGDGPVEHQALSSEYTRILDQKCAEVFREFGELRIAEQWEHNRDEFDELFEKGRKAIAGTHDRLERLKELIEAYEREAKLCTEVGAYYGACAALGAAMEARLLLQCELNPADTEAARSRLPVNRRPRTSNPAAWRLTDLLAICGEADWLPILEGELAVHIPQGWAHRLRMIRNLLHPSRHLVEHPHTLLGREALEDCQAAYILVKSRLGVHNKSEQF